MFWTTRSRLKEQKRIPSWIVFKFGSKENPPPEGVSYSTSRTCVRGPNRRICTRFSHTRGSWWGNIVNENPRWGPRWGEFHSIKVRIDNILDTFLSESTHYCVSFREGGSRLVCVQQFGHWKFCLNPLIFNRCFMHPGFKNTGFDTHMRSKWYIKKLIGLYLLFRHTCSKYNIVATTLSKYIHTTSIKNIYYLCTCCCT